jgi:hypothetical protein
MAKQKVQEQQLEEAKVNGQEPETPDVEQAERDAPEKLSRTECAQRVIAEIDGDCTLTELGERADKLFVAGRGGDEEYSDTEAAEWHLQKILQTLEGVGLVELGWECVVHPLVARLGLPSKDGK